MLSLLAASMLVGFSGHLQSEPLSVERPVSVVPTWKLGPTKEPFNTCCPHGADPGFIVFYAGVTSSAVAMCRNTPVDVLVHFAEVFYFRGKNRAGALKMTDCRDAYVDPTVPSSVETGRWLAAIPTRDTEGPNAIARPVVSFTVMDECRFEVVSANGETFPKGRAGDPYPCERGGIAAGGLQIASPRGDAVSLSGCGEYARNGGNADIDPRSRFGRFYFGFGITLGSLGPIEAPLGAVLIPCVRSPTRSVRVQAGTFLRSQLVTVHARRGYVFATGRNDFTVTDDRGVTTVRVHKGSVLVTASSVESLDDHDFPPCKPITMACIVRNAKRWVPGRGHVVVRAGHAAVLPGGIRAALSR